MEKFKYLGMTVTNQNLIHEEMKSRLNSGNACCHSVQKLLSYCLLKNLKIKIYRTIIMPIIWYRGETQTKGVRKQGVEGNILTHKR
jgi:hypothetical protein